MLCPFCESKSFVIQSRMSNGRYKTRRHICEGCKKRFTTLQICLIGDKLYLPKAVINQENLERLSSLNPGPVTTTGGLPKSLSNRQQQVQRVRKHNIGTVSRKDRACRNCELWSRHGCSLGIPDAGGKIAAVCEHFENVY